MSSDSHTPAQTPIDASALLEQGRMLLKSGQHREALVIADRLLKESEETPEALLFAGEVHFSRANFVESERLARQCTQHFPNEFGGPVLLCRALMATGKLGEARDMALNMADKDISNDSHIEILVTVLSGCMVPESAYPLCKRAVALDPYNPAAHRRLALTCRLIGRIDEAVEAADIALRFDAHDYEMIGLRSVLQTVTAEKNHIAELEALLAAGCRNAIGGARVAYALAKEHEETGEHKRSFGFLEAGAKFKRQTIKYEVSEDTDTFQTLQELFDIEALTGMSEGFDTKEPIFILGLPRTGSTLVERIISSHSAVYAAGELHHFSGAVMEEVRKLGSLADRADLVRKSLQIDPNAIGRRYLERTRPFAGHTPYFIDKLPLNFISIGLIHRALPNATIIHVRRSPMDACYAAYKFLFNEAYAWSYDLNEIAQFYIGYRQLMDHWRTVIPGRIIDVTYEDVVEDLEGEAKRLIATLGLEWEPACLEFHENKAAAMTGSAVQVRKKIYSSSVGRWRDYETQLQPLANALEAAGIDPVAP
jgi:tetratricopeptide (TPR) repeat protein